MVDCLGILVGIGLECLGEVLVCQLAFVSVVGINVVEPTVALLLLGLLGLS